MLPTDLTRAVFHYGTSTLVVHRADGDTITQHMPPSMSISEVEEFVRNWHGDLPVEVECSTAFGILKGVIGKS